MNKNYYYVVSTLPVLRLGKKAPLEKDDFMKLCSLHLAKDDLDILHTAALHGVAANAGGPGVLNEWYRWNEKLSQTLASLRKERISLKRAVSGDYAREPAYSPIAHIAGSAFREASPLMADEILTKARWDFLTHLEFGHYFDIERLLIYLLKLLILQRNASFNKDRGETLVMHIIDIQCAGLSINPAK
ncbi:MAG: DUF2764 family protein [Nitrospirae bacterium]|nr:DUF2764 family protein [Nitrospirota bacterium]